MRWTLRDRSSVEKLAAAWVAVASRKESWDPVRGYVARYGDAAIDSERARQEAAAASELTQRFLSYGEDAPLDAT